MEWQAVPQLLPARPDRPQASLFVLQAFGHLKLSVSPENGRLFVHVLEARGLQRSRYRPCDSYVKLAVVPDADHTKRWRTRTILDCRAPTFNETFVLDLGVEDHLKRLLVTVWNRSRTSRRSDLLGCMSFGVRSLITAQKVIGGWYYLLGEELGRSKHLKVAARRIKRPAEPAVSSHVGAHAGPDPASAENMQSLSVTVLRGKDGYGFTICSDSPVRVQAVDPGDPMQEGSERIRAGSAEGKNEDALLPAQGKFFHRTLIQCGPRPRHQELS
ncbi:hypothetical protein AALO_G00074040 [Alosa alosa]|uniref:C2 domain-containing protein n=1 Tax=Alosa alosa TaxID=278164 RepID=A0AAV6H2M9_9TELE|nr:hypothetical protein AALO_G00074040 [Alosa alosa]